MTQWKIFAGLIVIALAACSIENKSVEKKMLIV